ncbi:MAG: ABC transporter permease [Deltaproteobacteria bacterium]|nr:ABC transporter permease [Deltaproteobacteria bacterium]
MTWFLLKGLLRDRNRSLFQILVVTGGVMITILIYCWLLGVKDDVVMTNAKLDTGHVKIMTRAYSEISSQMPNDLSLPGVGELVADLKETHPRFAWAPRIKFGGLLDFPDEKGETRAQGPVFGIALDLISPDTKEKERLNLKKALIRGRLPRSPGEIIVSEQLTQNLGVNPGEAATLISATANGGMAIHNFIVVGTVGFGISALDRNAMLAHISDVQYALDMDDSAGEILGFFQDMIHNKEGAAKIAAAFNASSAKSENELEPVMITLREQHGLGAMLDMVAAEIFIIISGLVFVMSIVLWNTGLMSGLRRYGEMGVRMAIGESKGHVYGTLIYESILIGIVGSIPGTVIGIGLSYYFQKHGLDISGVMKGATMLMSNVMRARVTPAGYFIGLIPGILALLLGTMIAGIGIFRRQTSQLFKELET